MKIIISGSWLITNQTSLANLKNLLIKGFLMDLSRLKWIKVVTPPAGWTYDWAYLPDYLIAELKKGEQIIYKNGLTIFPLGFKDIKAENPEINDLMALTQRSKITHIVEFLDDKPYEEYDEEGTKWFCRYVKVVWWKPELKTWEDLPDREIVLGCDISPQQTIPYEFSSFKNFQEEWGNKGGLEQFRAHLAEQLKLMATS